MCQAVELDQSVQQKFHRTREELSNALVERDQEVDLLLTSLICRENPLLIGPPGTGKSQAIVSMAASVLLQGGTVLVASKNHQALDAVAQAIINRRLESRARGGGSFLYAQVQQDDVSRSTDATFVTFAPLTGDWQAALADVRAVIADALTNPPTQ